MCRKYANCIFLIKQDGNVKPLAVQSLSKPGQEQIWFKTRIIDEYVETYNHDGKWRLWFDLIKKLMVEGKDLNKKVNILPPKWKERNETKKKGPE